MRVADNDAATGVTTSGRSNTGCCGNCRISRGCRSRFFRDCNNLLYDDSNYVFDPDWNFLYNNLKSLAFVVVVVIDGWSLVQASPANSTLSELINCPIINRPSGSKKETVWTSSLRTKVAWTIWKKHVFDKIGFIWRSVNRFAFLILDFNFAIFTWVVCPSKNMTWPLAFTVIDFPSVLNHSPKKGLNLVVVVAAGVVVVVT